MGNLYKNGQGVEKNYAEAVKWFTMAAEKGNAQAQYELGQWYEFGRNPVEQSYTEALKWYQKAAAQEHEDAEKKADDLDQQYVNIVITSIKRKCLDDNDVWNECRGIIQRRYDWDSCQKLRRKYHSKHSYHTETHIINDNLPFSLKCCVPKHFAVDYAAYLAELGIDVELQPTEDILPEIITAKSGNFLFGKKFLILSIFSYFILHFNLIW